MPIPQGTIKDVTIHVGVLKNGDYDINYTIEYNDGEKVRVSESECTNCSWNEGIRSDLTDNNIPTGDYNIKEISNNSSIDPDAICKSEPVEIDDTTSITLNVQKMVFESVNGFFFIEPGEFNDYGLSVQDANDVNNAPDGEKLNMFFSKKGIPNAEQPGLSNLIDKFIRSVTKAMLFFAKQFIAMKEAAMGLIEALKNPTKPENISFIAQIIEKLKGMIESIKKFFTDTVQWMKETFMGPLGEINVPTPDFIFNLGEIVPAMPYPVPMPKIPPTNMEGFAAPTVDGVDTGDTTIDDRVTSMFGYSNPANLAQINIMKNIPYLHTIDTSKLSVETLQDPSSDKELGASDLKRVTMFKSVATSPIKMVIGVINALLGAVVGLISFDFSKVTELVKMMAPTLDGMKLLVSKILDGIIPNASKVVNENGAVKPPVSQEELKAQVEKVKNVDVGNLKYTGGKPSDVKTNIDEYESSVQKMLNSKDNIIDQKERQSNYQPLKDYIDTIIEESKKISETETKINTTVSEVFMPNTFQIKDKVTKTNELISNVNSLDSKIDENGNFIDNKYNEDAIVTFFDGINPRIKDIEYYEENFSEVTDFFNFYDEVDHFPLKTPEINTYIDTVSKFTKLDVDTIETFFSNYDENYVDQMIVKSGDAISYVKKLRYIKYITRKKLHEYYSEYRDMMIDFRDNDLTLDLVVTSGWTTSIIFDFSEMENKYNEINNYIIGNVYSYFSDSSFFAPNINLSRKIMNDIPDALRNFQATEIVSTGEYGSFEFTLEPTFSIDEINDVISDIDDFLLLDNYDELLLIETDITTLNGYTYDGNTFEEDSVIQYLEKVKKIFELEKEFIEKDKNTLIYDDNGIKINDSIRKKCTEFLLVIVNKSKEIEDSQEDMEDVIKQIEESTALEEKLATTPPDKDQLSDLIMPVTGIVENIPNVILSIFKGIFSYALEGLPSFLLP